jgi:D-amino peptidase
MIAWICTDMEGLAGIDHWDQCYGDGPEYHEYGRAQLTADTNAAIAGCFDAGATQVRVLDGHGRNRNQGFTTDLDPRATRVWISGPPTRMEGLDETVHVGLMVGQHARAGTLHGFLDHTQSPKLICRMTAGGAEIGETGQFALYCGAFGVPVCYLSGDEAACREAEILLPQCVTTPTKRGTGWATCELYDPETVRARIQADAARAIGMAHGAPAFRLPAPFEVTVEYAYSEPADNVARWPAVRRPHARVVTWTLQDAADIYTWPSGAWAPGKDEHEHEHEL